MSAALFCAVLGDEDPPSRGPSWPRLHRTAHTLDETSHLSHVRRDTVRAPRRAFDLPEDIAARIRARAPAALELLIEVTFERLVQFAYGFVRSHDAAEDVVQEVFVRIWSQGESWNPAQSVTAYLYAAVRNRALNSIRARTADARLRERALGEAEGAAEWLHLAPPSMSPEQMIRWQELMAIFDQALAELTERQRSALLLRFEQGLTVPEIAHVLEISVKAAEKLVSRGLHKLRSRMMPVLG